jgi:recombination protein RecR
MRVPKPISNLIDAFERLPGIGPKTASRLTFYLLRVPQSELSEFAKSLTELKTGTKLCSICKNVGENDVCSVCDDPARDKNIIAVVASPMDVFALEKTGYKGMYHVLHGIIDPLNNIGPDEIYIDSLVGRLKDLNGKVEVILATNTSMEGESTAMYIQKLIREGGFDEDAVKITRIARGLPVGGDIEYADDITLSRALEGRVKF